MRDPVFHLYIKLEEKYAEANPVRRLTPNISELNVCNVEVLLKFLFLHILVVIWFKNCKTVVSFDWEKNYETIDRLTADLTMLNSIINQKRREKYTCHNNLFDSAIEYTYSSQIMCF